LKGPQSPSKLEQKQQVWSLKCSKKHTFSNLVKNPTKWTNVFQVPKFGYKKGSKNEPKRCEERRRSDLLYTPKGTHLLSFTDNKLIT